MAGSIPVFASKRNAAQYFAQRGFFVFPLANNSKSPRSLTEFGSWKERATCDPAQVDEWWRRWPEANIGCHPGASGHIVLDVDDKNGKTGSVSLAMLEVENGPLPPTMTCVTATGGRHLWFKGDGFNTAGDLGPGLDTRGAGGFLVMPGSTVPAGEYALVDASEPAPAPPWFLAKMAAIASRREERKRIDGIVDLDQPGDIDRAAQHLRDLVSAGDVAIEGQGGNNRTYRLAQTMRDLGVTPETALSLILQHWNDYCSPPWDSFELSTIVDNAYRYGQNEVGVKALGRADGSCFIAVNGVRYEVSENSGSVRSKTEPATQAKIASRFHILDEAAQDKIPEPLWLIPGWLAHQDIGLLYGAPGSYKSFFGLHLALSVAAGIPVPGIKYPTGYKIVPYTVLYIAGEGAVGIARKRRPAWRTHNKIEKELPFYLATVPPLVRDKASVIDFMKELDAIVEPNYPRLIVYDTYARTMAGLDENDAGDAGLAMEMFADLSRKYASAGLIIHHANKSGDERGSTALRASVDAVFKCEADRATKTVVVSADKTKDTDEPHPLAFTIIKVGSSAVLEPCAKPVYGKTGPSQLKLDVARVLHEAGATKWTNALNGAALAESLLLLWGETDDDPEAQKRARTRVQAQIRAAEKRGDLRAYTIPNSSPAMYALPEETFQLKNMDQESD